MTTVRAWLDASPISRRDSEFLLATELRLSRTQLIAHPETILTAEQETALANKLSDIESGTPLAYILGEWEFWGINLRVNEHTLVPRPDTELLVELIAKLAPQGATLIDLGTGTGAIAIALAKERADLNITATDKSCEALRVASENALANDVQITFTQSDWFANIEGRFDVIVSNPPYIAEGDPHLPSLSKEPSGALVSGPDGMRDLTSIVQSARQYLTPKGLVLVEHGFGQGQQVRTLFADSGYRSIATHRDLGDNERVTLGYV